MTSTLHILSLVLLLMVFVCDGSSQSDSTSTCPSFDLLQSMDAVVVGDKVTFNIVSSGGNLKRSELRFKWTVFPRGKIVTSRNSTFATLDTSSVGGNWAVISADFENWKQCNWHDSQEIRIRRKGPYTLADEFWWWFHRNETKLSAYNDSDHKEWLDRLQILLHVVDKQLTFSIDWDRKDPMKNGFIVDYKGNPYDAKLVNEFIARAPSLAGWDIVKARP